MNAKIQNGIRDWMDTPKAKHHERTGWKWKWKTQSQHIQKKMETVELFKFRSQQPIYQIFMCGLPIGPKISLQHCQNPVIPAHFQHAKSPYNCCELTSHRETCAIKTVKANELSDFLKFDIQIKGMINDGRAVDALLF